MVEPKVLISKKSIKTMGKDMVRIKRGELDVGEKGKEDQKALSEEIQRRKQEEERLRSLQEQGKKIAEQARQEKEPAPVPPKRDPDEVRQEEIKKQAEVKRLAALQEARKKAEEESKARAEKPIAAKVAENKPAFAEASAGKEDILEKIKEIKLEKAKIQEGLNNLTQNKKPLDVKKKAILNEIKMVELSFQEARAREEELWQKLSIIEKKESQAQIPEERRELEKKRWKLEKKREELEKKRWPADEKLEQLEAKLKGLEKEGKELGIKEKELFNRQKDISQKEQDLNLKLERINLQETLEEIKESKSLLEEKVNVLFKNNEEAENNLFVVSAEEKKVEQEKIEIENKERVAENISQRRELEKTRWQTEEKRRRIESKRWKMEEEKEKISQDLKDSQNRLKSILDKKENISKRLEEINLLLEGKQPAVAQESSGTAKPAEVKPASIPKPPEPPKPKTREELLEEVEEERVAKIEEARKRIDTLKKAALERKQRQEQMKKAVLPPMARQKLEPGHEKPEPIVEERRAEIMKRLSLPILKQAVKEQPKIPETEEIIRVVPKKPSFREKLWVRALIVAATLVILAGILTFWYWYFRIRTSGPAYPPGYEKEKEGISIPPALFDITDTVIITISDAEDLSEALKKSLQVPRFPSQFKRIIIKKEGEIVGVKELFNLLEVKVPDNFYDNIIDEPTMFIYSQGQGGRFGFVVKASTSAQALNIVLRAMEPTAEADFENLFVLMGKEEKAVAPYFKNAEDMEDYTGPDFRFKTLNQNDLGIFYLATDYYFVFSSSLESTENLLIKIQEFLENKVLLGDLKPGDQGKQVSLLQNWLAKEFSIESPSFNSGLFNQATKDYVIRFQEKYATDILIPQGQTKGTGIVDLATRKKLNQIYSDF